MEIDQQKNALISRGFNSNLMYFEMMRNWHQQHDGLAIEPEVKAIIQDQCLSGRRILEAGCGEGSITLWFAQRYPMVNFVGVDISRIGIDMARQHGLLNTEFHVADLKTLPYRDDSFDFLFSQSVLEHVVDWQIALREMHRVLRKGGRLLIRAGNGGPMNKHFPVVILNYLLRRNRTLTKNPSFELKPGDHLAHMKNFDIQEIPSDILLAELRASGYRIENFTTRTHVFRKSPLNWKVLLLWGISMLDFWPFNHLGPTTVVIARK